MDGQIKKAQVFKSIGQNKLLIGGPIEHMILKRIGQNEPFMGESIKKTHVLKSFGRNKPLIGELIKHKILKISVKTNRSQVNRS